MQTIQILIVGDPVSTLKTQGDTSIALAEEALRRNWEVFWCTPEALRLNSHPEVEVFASCVQVKRASVEGIELSEPALARTLSGFDSIWIRKDPPFDTTYWAWCGWLSLLEKRVLIQNAPHLFLMHHEKLLPFEGVERGYFESSDLIETSVVLKTQEVQHNAEAWIQKPWLGHGGRGVEVLDWKRWNASMGTALPEPMMVQPLVEAVHTVGDRRVFILDGQVMGSFVRLPPEGSVRSNLASGGRAVVRPMTEEEEVRAQKVARFTKDLGFLWVGLDLLGGKISEINFTSPTGVRTLQQLQSIDLAELYCDIIERQLKERARAD